MTFSVGYQLAGPDEQPFSEIVAEFRPHIAEVYFPWLGMVRANHHLRPSLPHLQLLRTDAGACAGGPQQERVAEP